MTDDVVAELDAWLAENVTAIIDCTVVERARDEIVALRAMREAHIRMLSAKLDEDEENMRRWIAKARNEALEEAAKRALDLDEPIVAAAIRALTKQ